MLINSRIAPSNDIKKVSQLMIFECTYICKLSNALSLSVNIQTMIIGYIHSNLA